MSPSRELFRAIASHDVDEVTDALAYGASANAVEPEPPHRTALQAAVAELVEGGPVEALTALLRAGAAVDATGPGTDATPLLMALQGRQGQAARALLDAGADPNRRSVQDVSPLLWCVAHDDAEMVETLLRHGADASLEGVGAPDRGTALGLAAARGHSIIVDLLLRGGAAPLQRDTHGLTARERAQAAARNQPEDERAPWTGVVEMLDQAERGERPAREVVLEGSQVRDEADLHRLLAKALDFPSHYGANLHALWDVLTGDVERPVMLVWRDAAHTRAVLGPRFDAILHLLRAVKEDDASRPPSARFDYRLS